MMEMTLEQALIIGISSVTAALVFVVKELWKRSVACEKESVVMRLEQSKTREQLGMFRGFFAAVRRCPTPNCQFKAMIEAIPHIDEDKAERATFSVQVSEKS